MARTPAELRAWLADIRRELRDDALLQGKTMPRSNAETAVWHAGMVDRFDLDPEPDDNAPVSAVEQAVQARIAAARARAAREAADRATRGRRRRYGVAARHAAKLRHLDARDAKKATTDPQETDHA